MAEVTIPARAHAIANSHIQLRIRTNLSPTHIEAAALFARMAGEFELAADKREGVIFTAHWPYVLGAITESVAFLEANVNEFLEDMMQAGSKELYENLAIETRERVGIVWQVLKEKERISVLDKYQLVLRLAQVQPFAAGSDPFQSASKLIELRNAVVHFKPEWWDDTVDAGRHKALYQKLRGSFPQNRLVPVNSSPYFPTALLGYGCAAWSVNSAIRFVHEFNQRIGAIDRFVMTRTNVGVDIHSE